MPLLLMREIVLWMPLGLRFGPVECALPYVCQTKVNMLPCDGGYRIIRRREI